MHNSFSVEFEEETILQLHVVFLISPYSFAALLNFLYFFLLLCWFLQFTALLHSNISPPACFSCSTIGAIIMTPLLTKLLAGQLVPVDAAVRTLQPCPYLFS